MTVNDVYTEVCDVLLEPLPAGLSLGVYTQAQFLLDFATVFHDLLQQAGLVRKLTNLQAQAATSQYTVPDHAMDVQETLFDDRYLRRESGLDLDQLVRKWRAASANRPERWHEDRLGLKTVELQPTPSNTGNNVATSTDFYGTIGAMTAGTITLSTSAPLYGTIASYTSQIYIETPVPLFGTISDLVSSNGNLTLVATGKPIQTSYVLTDRIEILPDSWVPYIKYGILAVVFGRDGETRDVLRERYCSARLQEGINLAKAISLEYEEEEVGA